MPYTVLDKPANNVSLSRRNFTRAACTSRRQFRSSSHVGGSLGLGIRRRSLADVDIGQHGRLDAGVLLLSKPYRKVDLAAKVHALVQMRGEETR